MSTRDELDQLLMNLRLAKMRQQLTAELERAARTGCPVEETLARLLREQWHHQQERSAANRMAAAKIPEKWELDTFPYDRQPGVNPAQIRQLASLDFVASGTNVVLIGETGVGKTGLGTGLLLTALRNGYRGRFIKAQDLFDEMYASLADRTTRRLLDSLARLDVLQIDELGYLTIRPEQSNIFFKLMDLRHQQRRATVITTNLRYDDWAALLGNPRLTMALLDRLRQRCVTLSIEGPSLRKSAA